MSKLQELQAEVVLDLMKQRGELIADLRRAEPSSQNYTREIQELRNEITCIDMRIDGILNNMTVSSIEVVEPTVVAGKKIKTK